MIFMNHNDLFIMGIYSIARSIHNKLCLRPFISFYIIDMVTDKMGWSEDYNKNILNKVNSKIK